MTGIRIIPARAGFTSILSPVVLFAMDHPRSRGVYRLGGDVAGHPGGSSPLARGLLGVVDGVLKAGGIIPARAGFTSCRATPSSRSPDHPRSRGVYVSVASGVPETVGSSPLARGLLTDERSHVQGARIIPARAGFTGLEVRSPYHPDGSSPLARGLR